MTIINFFQTHQFVVFRVLQAQLQVYYSIKCIIVAMIEIWYSNCSSCSSPTNSHGVHCSDNNLQAMPQTYVVFLCYT